MATDSRDQLAALLGDIGKVKIQLATASADAQESLQVQLASQLAEYAALQKVASSSGDRGTSKPAGGADFLSAMNRRRKSVDDDGQTFESKPSEQTANVSAAAAAAAGPSTRGTISAPSRGNPSPKKQAGNPLSPPSASSLRERWRALKGSTPQKGGSSSSSRSAQAVSAAAASPKGLISFELH
ncbi:unnamed protein product [Polarella glacialis]|uniref:Uncharacterized protein n=1 Tax=Polarella glacialis TaxID=89957 RepID=A0A813JPY0_POLGL|nr:unnamed protein product [Polarella glacialis]